MPDLSSPRKFSIYPFLMVGFVAGALLAVLLSPVFSYSVGIFDYTSVRDLFCFWIGFYALMFLLAYPNAQSLKKLIVGAVIPSLLASVPYYWSDYWDYWSGYNVPSSFILLFFSAYALNAFHLNYQENGFHYAYQTLFYAVWDTFVKLLIALSFTLFCWLVLFLCAELFSTISVTFFNDLIAKLWFKVGSTTVFISIGLYIAAQTENIVRSVRMVLLIICQYLLIPLAIISILFIVMASIVAYQHHALFRDQFLFASIAFLCVLFLNGIYQDGLVKKLYPNFLLWICRVFLWITPLFTVVELVIYCNTFNRISDSFNSRDFPYLLNMVLLLMYNLSYAIIAMRKQKDWLKPIEWVNVALAIILIIVTFIVTNPIFIKHLPMPQGSFYKIN